MNNVSKEILSRLKGLRKNQPISIAHRGASAWANENTLRAFRIANKLCSQMWELDVQLTKDKICVVCHDDNLLRLTGYDLNIFECNWDDLKNIPLKKGGHLTTLSEVIILCEELNSWLYIEIKGQGAGIAALNELRNNNFQNALLGSFEIDFLICLYISETNFAHSYKGKSLPVQNLELLWWVNRKNKMNVPKVDIKQLLEAGVHLGHKTLRWNPKMKKYIFGEKNSIHIIDLTQTVEFIKNALVQVHKIISSGGKLLVVSTKKQASEQVSELAKEKIGRAHV